MINSLTNERIKQVIKLYTAKGRKETGLFVVEGPHLVKEAKMAGVLVETYTTTNESDGILVSEDVMKKICKTDTVVKEIGVCKMLIKNDICDKVLILDGIQDPGNMGTLMRSAVAFGFNTIFLADGCVDIYNDKVIRSSQGAIFKLNFIKGEKIAFINNLKKTHQIFSTNVTKGKNVKTINKDNKVALILGNEGKGVSEEINNLDLDNLYIPLINTESLNVAIAGAILMYELS